MIFFEWDPSKSALNKKKHGVNFDEATQIWQGIHLTAAEIAYSKEGETRNVTMGLIGNKIYTAICSSRNDKIRLISVRRARYGEEKVFQNKIFQNHKGDG